MDDPETKMSDTFEFPDHEDIPTIRVEKEDPFEAPAPTKHLFIKYNSDEWNKENLQGTVQTINHLFGQDVQVVVMDEKLEFLSREEVSEILADRND